MTIGVTEMCRALAVAKRDYVPKPGANQPLPKGLPDDVTVRPAEQQWGQTVRDLGIGSVEERDLFDRMVRDGLITVRHVERAAHQGFAAGLVESDVYDGLTQAGVRLGL